MPGDQAPHDLHSEDMDFTQKARFVARGDLATAPPSVACPFQCSFWSSVRLAFLIAGLNDLKLLACDESNACLNGPACREAVWSLEAETPEKTSAKCLLLTELCADSGHPEQAGEMCSLCCHSR